MAEIPEPTVDPTPPTEPSKEMGGLIADYGNATFDCGEWTAESEELPKPYDHYLLISNHARAAVRSAVASLESENIALRSQLASREEDMANLLRFAGKGLDVCRVAVIGDWDGGDVQDTMVECGLLAPVEALEPCGENCRCVEYDDFPQTCYRYTPLGERAYAAALSTLRTER